eukprot:93344_1
MSEPLRQRRQESTSGIPTKRGKVMGRAGMQEITNAISSRTRSCVKKTKLSHASKITKAARTLRSSARIAKRSKVNDKNVGPTKIVEKKKSRKRKALSTAAVEVKRTRSGLSGDGKKPSKKDEKSKETRFTHGDSSPENNSDKENVAPPDYKAPAHSGILADQAPLKPQPDDDPPPYALSSSFLGSAGNLRSSELTPPQSEPAPPVYHMGYVARTPQSVPSAAPCDTADARDAQCVTDYVCEIFANARKAEMKRRPDPDYMSSQSDINARMRTILVDWMVEVHEKFRLVPESLYVAIHILDRFLAASAVSRSRLQLVGCAAMLLATKYQEIYPPEIRDFVFISDHAYQREEILKMESLIINTLQWSITHPTPYFFARRFLRVAGASRIEVDYCNFLLELCLLEYRMLKYRSSELAASALYLALKVCSQAEGGTQQQTWTEFLIEQTGYTKAEMTMCKSDMTDILIHPNPKEKAVRKKYAKEKFSRVSQIELCDASGQRVCSSREMHESGDPEGQ